jgi:hypothetical protein
MKKRVATFLVVAGALTLTQCQFQEKARSPKATATNSTASSETASQSSIASSTSSKAATSSFKKLHILFTGMVIYNPSHGRSSPTSGDDVVLLFPNMPLDHAPANDPSKAIHAHQAFIAFPKSGYFVPDPKKVVVDPALEYAYILLNANQHLSIAEDPKTKVTFDDAAVVHISDLCAGSEPDPAEFATPSTKSIATALFQSGNVSVKGRTLCEFDFAACTGSKGRPRSDMPNLVELTIDKIPPTATEITFKNKMTHPFLTLKYPAGVDELYVRIGNLETGDRYLWLQDHTPPDVKDPTVYDFESFYMYAKGPVGARPPIPKRAPGTCKIPPTTAGADSCPPATP